MYFVLAICNHLSYFLFMGRRSPRKDKPMNNILKVIQFLKNKQAQIVFESEEDDGAAEFYGHISDVIDDLEAGKMTIEEAGDSLGMNLG